MELCLNLIKIISLRYTSLPKKVLTKGKKVKITNMALIKCTECGQMISDRAVRCPKCGCPRDNEALLHQNDDAKTSRFVYKIIIVFFVVIMAIFAVRSCYRSIMINVLNRPEAISSTVVDDSRNDEYANDDIPKNLPKWVQGQWSYRDENGFTISVSIHGRTISENSGGETSYGTITYENGIITAHFSDGHDMRYKVYKDERVIDAGSSNLRMKKIE